MPRLEGPLFGEDSSGTVAGVVTYSRAFETLIARSVRSPVYQRTAAQDAIRSSYSTAVAAWNALSPDDKQSWRLRAPAPLTGFNLFMKAHFLGLALPDFPALHAYYSLVPFGQITYGLDG